MRVEWASYLFDIRLGFIRKGKWSCYLSVGKPVTQNFPNGIFTINAYVVKTTLWNFLPILIPRVGVVIRPLHDWWFEAGIGYLFDRGEFGAKFVVMNWASEEKFNPGCNAKGWEEGSV